MPDKEGKFARVVVPSPLEEPLTYAVPSALKDSLKIGMRVLVPLGKRKVTGLVVDFLTQTSLKQVKEILTLLDEKPVLDSILLKLSRWMAQYYLSPAGEVVAAMLPPNLRVESRRVAVLRPGEPPLTGGLEKRIVEELKRKKGKMTVKSLAHRLSGGSFYRALDRLVAMGVVELRESIRGSRSRTRLKRESLSESTGGLGEMAADQQSRWALTPEQEQALDAVRERLKAGGFEVFLLCGVTGSGKTEIYLRAMEEVRRAQKRSLILIPEIALTPQLTDRLMERFGKGVGILHSGLTNSERWAQWGRIQRGDVVVVVGARSAIFAPVPDLGLIVVDEEHDTSYKQEEGVRYHARDLAVVRGKLAGCPVLLGSATPAAESFENCRQGRYRLLELTQRVEQKPMPQVEAVDLRSDRDREAQERSGNDLKSRSVISPLLKQALQENYQCGQQSLIFLNRRGFANFLQCRLCGLVLHCPRCSVSLTFHLEQKSVVCHHCGHRKPASDLCPGCGSLTLAPIGIGTEQVEQELHRFLPEARIARMDRDTTSKRGSHERLIRQWEKGEIEVLLGTQMITKGHDVSGVTLVGVILADLSLNLPDFRAAERTFQLLSQVAGRAGRGKEPGRVIIQTYAPDHYVFQYVMSHDYKGFFASEREFRRALNYPPFSRLVHLRLEGSKPDEVEEKAMILASGLRRRQGDPKRREIEILGPAPAPIEKLRGRYRWQILLKGKEPSSLLELAGQARTLFLQSRSARLYIDVDPYNML